MVWFTNYWEYAAYCTWLYFEGCIGMCPYVHYPSFGRCSLQRLVWNGLDYISNVHSIKVTSTRVYLTITVTTFMPTFTFNFNSAAHFSKDNLPRMRGYIHALDTPTKRLNSELMLQTSRYMQNCRRREQWRI